MSLPFISPGTVPFTYFKRDPKKYCDLILSGESKTVTFCHKTYGSFVLMRKADFLEVFPKWSENLPSAIRLRSFRDDMKKILSDLAQGQYDGRYSAMVFSRKCGDEDDVEFVDFVLVSEKTCYNYFRVHSGSSSVPN